MMSGSPQRNCRPTTACYPSSWLLSTTWYHTFYLFLVAAQLFANAHCYTMKNIFMITPDPSAGCSPDLSAGYKDRIEYGNGGFIYSHNPFRRKGRHYDRPSKDMNCFLVLIAPAGYRVELRALQFYLDGVPTHDGLCNGDTLAVLDYQKKISAKNQKPGLGQFLHNTDTQFCGRLPNQTTGPPLFLSTKNAVRLWLHVKKKPEKVIPSGNTGFKVMWTAVRETSDDSCAESEFKCNNQRCIPVDQACDTFSRCGDGSDNDRALQLKAGCDVPPLPEKRLSEAAIACMAFGGALVVILLISLLVICCGRQFRSKEKHQQSTSSVSSTMHHRCPPPGHQTAGPGPHPPLLDDRHNRKPHNLSSIDSSGQSKSASPLTSDDVQQQLQHQHHIIL